MARPTTDRLLEGINRVDDALQTVEQVERTWNNTVNTVREIRSLSENIANTTRAIVTDAKALLSGDLFNGSALSAVLNSANIFPGAQPNVLHQFRSFNCIFELSCLAPNDFNDPIGGYRSRRPSQVICRSGGGAEPKVTTQWESKGKVEYFIDNVEINTHMANTALTGTTNATGVQFDVTEPLSMGLFLQSLQNAANRLGYGNYLEAPFMLSIEFVGHTDDDQTKSLPVAKRYIPIKLYEAKMRVSEAGTVYSVRAYPYNHVSMSDTVNKVNSTVTITTPEDGEHTVQEMLQKGDNSLTGVVNKFFNTRVQQNPNAPKEEIFIVFPKEISAAAATGLGSSAQEAAGATGATASPTELLGTLSAAANTTANAVGQVRGGLAAWDVDAPALRNVQQELQNATEIANAAISVVNTVQSLGTQVSSVLSSAFGRGGGGRGPSFQSAGEVRRRRSEGDARIAEANAAADAFTIGGVQASREGETNSLVQDPGSLSEIGSSKMGTTFNSAGNSPFANVTETTNDDGTFKRNNITISADRRTYSFPAGTKITKIIEEILISSEWGQKFADRVDSQGMVDWFTIDPQVFLVGSASDTARGGISKVYVFRVLPTKVHTSKFQPPTAQGQGYNQIAPNVTKVYDYIYTGKNKDILDFNIEFNMAFVTTVQADMGNSPSGPSGTMNTETDIDNNQQTAGGAPNTQANAGSSTIQPQVTHSRPPVGGGPETPAVRNARMFHNAIIDGAADMVELDMTILGDPYFLSDTGFGNYTADLGSTSTVTADGTMDYQRSEIDIVVNFRTPLDYGGPGGYIEMLSDTVPVAPFSGLYQVVTTRHLFEQGEFKTELHVVRRRNQEVSLTSGPGGGGSNTMLTERSEGTNPDLDPTTAVGGT